MAGIVPHTPLLIPTIAKETLTKLEKTVGALKKLEEELYIKKPDTIIIFSPHIEAATDHFTLQHAAQFEANLKEFGDLTTHTKFKGEMPLTAAIIEAARKNNFPVSLTHSAFLNYGAVTPLTYLTAHLPKASVLPISTSEHDYKQHVDFGQFLQEQIMQTNKRIAVIASADLSHALTTDSPAGFHPEAKNFDDRLQELLASENTTGMIQMDPELVRSAAECGFKSILLLMGVLRGFKYNYQHYAYEAPFGVGYLTAHFSL